MANISISDLNPAGSGLFAGSENFIQSIKDLSDNELTQTRGGGGYSSGSGGYGSGSGEKNFSNKSSSGHGYDDYYCY